ncbi:MAG TPA: hypothetical protein VMN36_04750 [Verrucomicrobiales bacterium]|nr:hypothetical protein [Verrucomicrobiales bacterium]
MNLPDPHFRCVDHAAHWRRIAGHLEGRPQDFEVALDNLDRWEQWGRTHPGPIGEWRKRIRAAQASETEFHRLLEFLREDNHDSEPLKSCSPFVGLPPSRAGG